MEIEAPDRNDTRPDPLQILRHRGASLGILQSAHDVARFVKHQVDEWFGLDAAPVHFDPAVLRIRLGSQLRHDLAIDRNSTFRDQLLGLSPRRNAGPREKFLQALLSHGERLAERRAAR